MLGFYFFLFDFYHQLLLDDDAPHYLIDTGGEGMIDDDVGNRYYRPLLLQRMYFPIRKEQNFDGRC